MDMGNSRVIRLLFIVVLSVSGFNKKLNANTYQFEPYSITQGLNHTHVLSIFQDSKGFLRIGTYGGLHLFNGYSFQVFTADVTDDKSISNNTVNAIYEDSNGFLWFGTEDGLNKYDHKTGEFKKYAQTKGQLNFNKIKTIHEDAEGNIWVGTYGGGLNKFNVSTNTFEYFT